MQSITRAVKFLTAAMLLTVSASATAQLVAGRDYRNIKPPQPTASAKEVEVLEFFWYACPHCDHLQAPLHAWLKRKPADVAFRRQPAVLSDSWVQLARTYYAIETMGLVDKLHGEVFDAIHRQKKLDPNVLNKDPKTLFDWVAGKGVEQKKFVDAYNSFAVVSKAKRTEDTTSAYGVSGTPAIVVDGRFLTAPSMMPPSPVPDYARFFKTVDELIAMARANRGGKGK